LLRTVMIRHTKPVLLAREADVDLVRPIWPELPRPRVLGLSNPCYQTTRLCGNVLSSTGRVQAARRRKPGLPSRMCPIHPHGSPQKALKSTDLCCFSQIRFRDGTPTFRMSSVRERSAGEGIGWMWYRRSGRNGPGSPAHGWRTEPGSRRPVRML
jgi:hypothetical protein